MNYTKLNEEVKAAALAQPNINTYTEGDINVNWHRGVKYAAVNMGLESTTRTSNTIIYNVILYYADRPTKDESNKISIYDDGVHVLQSILDILPDDISYTSPVIYTQFEQEFEDVLDGCYARISLETEYELGRCGFDTEIEGGEDTLEIDENGKYNIKQYTYVDVSVAGYIPPVLEELNTSVNGTYLPTEGKDGFDKVIVNVPVNKIGEITTTIDAGVNGDFTLFPSAGNDGISKANVHINTYTEEKAVNITENGTTEILSSSSGRIQKAMTKVTINTNVQPSLEEINIDENGTYLPSANKDGYSKIIVNVPDIPAELEELNAVENGTYYPTEGKDGFDKVIVNVPDVPAVLEDLNITENGTYLPSTGNEGFSKVIANIQPKLEEINIDENGTYYPSLDKDGYSKIIVNVPDVPAELEELNATENGTYLPTEGNEGFSKVIVNVPDIPPVLEELNTSVNGTYYPSSGKDGFDKVVVNVPDVPAVLEELSITENGTYLPSTGNEGFSKVIANIQPKLQRIETVIDNVPTNGTIELDPDEEHDGISHATVHFNSLTEQRTVNITENGTTEVNQNTFTWAAITKVTINTNVPSVTTVEMTQEEYDVLTTYDPYKIYLITE